MTRILRQQYLDKLDFKTMAGTKGKEWQQIKMKRSVKKRILYSLIYAPNITAPKYTKQTQQK